jgi:hypothetical protein
MIDGPRSNSVDRLSAKLSPHNLAYPFTGESAVQYRPSPPHSRRRPSLPRATLHLPALRPTEGLTNLAPLSLLQDREGFLWVGTQNGLFRYDGSRFDSLNSRPDIPPAGSSACTKIPMAPS